MSGTYPLFKYTQTNATIYGVDIDVNYTLLKHLELSSKYSLVRGYDRTAADWLVGIPTDRWQNNVRYQWQHAYIEIGSMWCDAQTRVPPRSDYVAPPPAYWTLRAAVGANLRWGQQPIVLTLTANNLLNTAYRDYLNRYRYFADEQGSIVSLNVRLPFGNLKHAE